MRARQAARSAFLTSPVPSPASQAGTRQDSNRIPAALAPDDCARLRPHLTTVMLKQKHSVWQPNQPFQEVYFPLDAVVSVLAVAEGGVVEVGTTGKEGVVGLPAFLSRNLVLREAALQRAGLIRYSRGTITIRDRRGLEQAACERYRIVRNEFDRLLGVPAG